MNKPIPVKTIFHGSEHIIIKPEYGKGALTNDYGRGFYCTESEKLAKEWACAKNTNGYANRYELNMTGLSLLNFNSEPYHILNWLAVLTDNRTYWQRGSISEEAKHYLREHFLVDVAHYDIIVGYRADDSYFSFAQDFVANAISLEKLSAAMRLGKLGEQIVLKSRKAFAAVKYMEAVTVNCEEYYIKKTTRDKEARREYRNSKKQTADIHDLFMLDIMREGIENGDTRLR